MRHVSWRRREGRDAGGQKDGRARFSSPEVQKQPDAELTAITVKGKNKMPSYEKSLKPEEIKDLIAYIRQLASGK